MLQKIIRYLALALILALSLCLISAAPAAALSLAEYFHLSYDPVSFSKNEIQGSETFHATIQGRATCGKDLPVSASEASITSRIIAEHTVSGASVMLNASYTISIKPFPAKAGDSIEINQDVPLIFPAQAESGEYNIIGQLIEAKVKVAFIWGGVTDYLPQDHLMGSVEYTAPESPPVSAPESTPVPAPESTPVSTPAPAPAPASTPQQTATPAPPEYGIPWWVWLIVVIAATTTMVNIAWFLRHRTSTTGQ